MNCNVKILSRKLYSPSLRDEVFQWFIFYKPACLLKNFGGRLLSIRVFSLNEHYGLCSFAVSQRIKTIASHVQFKPIKIGENLMVNYNELQRHYF